MFIYFTDYGKNQNIMPLLILNRKPLILLGTKKNIYPTSAYQDSHFIVQITQVQNRGTQTSTFCTPKLYSF